MKPITDEVIKGLRSRKISIDAYLGDEIVKALLDNDFDHDYILKSIDEGDIKLDKKPDDIEEDKVEEKKNPKKEDVEKEDIEEKEDVEEEDVEEKPLKKCDKMKKGKKNCEEEDIEKGDDEDIEEKEDIEEEIEKRVEKSLRMKLNKSLSARLEEMDDLIKSMSSEIRMLKSERLPFRTVNSGAVIEKSFNLGRDDDGKNLLSKSMNRPQISKELSKAFEIESDEEIKKSIGDDLLGYTLSGKELSQASIEALDKRGFKIVD